MEVNTRVDKILVQRAYDEALKLPLLDRKTERALAERIQNGSEEEKEAAVRKLVDHNVRLIFFAINEYNYFDYSANCLGAGMLGLRRAAELYDGSTKFSTYGTLWVRSVLKNWTYSDKAILSSVGAFKQAVEGDDEMERARMLALNNPADINARTIGKDGEGKDEVGYADESISDPADVVNHRQIIGEIREMVTAEFGAVKCEMFFRVLGGASFIELAREVGEERGHRVSSEFAEILDFVKKRRGDFSF